MASSSKFFVGLVKPFEGVALSPAYERHISSHGRFRLYSDLLELDGARSVVLVLAALRGHDVVRLRPEKTTRVTLATDPRLGEQLRITVDAEFVKKVLRQTKKDRHLKFEALDLSNIAFCYFTVDEINDIKFESVLRREPEEYVVEFPGEKIDFLKNHDAEKKRDSKSFYDLDGRRHVVQDKSKERKKEREGRKWWNRLSEARERLAPLPIQPKEGAEEIIDKSEF